MIFIFISLFLGNLVHSADPPSQISAPSTGETSYEQRAKAEPLEGINKIRVAMVGYKSLSESGEGDRWNFDLPSVGLEITANEFLSVQSSLTLLNQQYVIAKDGADVLMERRRLIVPLLVSYNVFTWLRLSAGPYAGFAINDLEVSRRGLSPGVRLPSSSIQDFLEFGFLSSVQFMVPVSKKFEGMIEIYHYVPYHEAELKKSNSLFFMAGIKFGIGG